MNEKFKRLKKIFSEEETNKHCSLQLILGGLCSENWLDTLPVGTVFLARQKDPTQWYLEQFRILSRTRFSTFLETPLKDDTELMAVMSERFIKIYDLHEVQYLGTNEDVEEEDN